MPEDKKKRTFEVEGKKYAVRVPTVDEIKKANEVRAKTFNESLSRGDLLRDQLETELRNEPLTDKWGNWDTYFCRSSLQKVRLPEY